MRQSHLCFLFDFEIIKSFSCKLWVLTRISMAVQEKVNKPMCAFRSVLCDS